MNADDTKRRLLFHAFLLFLLGLLTGIAVPQFKNTKLGLAAHLEGLMNGMYLALLAFAWKELRASPRTQRLIFGLSLFGTYLNWFATGLAGVFGTSPLTPISGAGYSAEPWQAVLISVMLVSLSLTMITALVLVVLSLRGPSVERSAQA